MSGELKGSYREVSKNTFLNLNSISAMWHQDDGVFKRDDKLTIVSCDKKLKLDKSPEDISALFNHLASGEDFVQIGPRCVRAKSIESIRYDGKRVRYTTTSGEYKEKVPKEEAKELLSKLEQQDRFEDIEGYLINMNRVVHMQYPEGFLSSNSLKITFMSGRNLELYAIKENAYDVLEKALEKPHMDRVGKDAINVAAIGSVSAWSGSKLEIEFPLSSCKVKLDENSLDAMKAFSKDKGFEPLNYRNSKAFNPNILSKAWRTAGRFLSSPTFTYGARDMATQTHAETEKSDPVLEAFLSRDDYVGIGEKCININSISCAFYDGERLRYIQGANAEDEIMSEDDARVALCKINAHEKFMEIDGRAVNIHFATGFRYDEGKVECIIGKSSFTFDASEEEALSFFKDVQEFEAKLSASREQNADPQGVDLEVNDYAWDPDLIGRVHLFKRMRADDEDDEFLAAAALAAALILTSD